MFFLISSTTRLVLYFDRLEPQPDRSPLYLLANMPVRYNGMHKLLYGVHANENETAFLDSIKLYPILN